MKPERSDVRRRNGEYIPAVFKLPGFRQIQSLMVLHFEGDILMAFQTLIDFIFFASFIVDGSVHIK